MTTITETTQQILYDPGARVPIYVWAPDVDENTLEQTRNLARLPFARKHIALMPDAHLGYGMPIGGVIATRDYVVPNAIGVDIGCGVHARRTNIEAGVLKSAHAGHGTVLGAVLNRIHRNVPCGNGPGGVHKLAPSDPWRSISASTLQDLMEDACPWVGPTNLETALDRGTVQLGTLGGGNHFIEVQEDVEGFVWLMLHSGSRALGKAICDHFNAVAVELNERYHSPTPRSAQLAYLHTATPEGQSYLAWMKLAMAWALENRRRMLDAAVEALFAECRGVVPDDDYLITEAVDTHHNYAVMEHHYGENVLVHRKGAVRARAGELVIIPGSMETGSYIARGLGNAAAFETAPHGAGRRLSRTAAKKERTAAACLVSLADKGILLAKHNKNDVAEEAGHAYKDVDAVMAASRDLVEPLFRLTPLGVVKG